MNISSITFSIPHKIKQLGLTTQSLLTKTRYHSTEKKNIFKILKLFDKNKIFFLIFQKTKILKNILKINS